MRLLFDAGADAALAVQLSNIMRLAVDGEGMMLFNKSPVAVLALMLREKNVGEKDAAEVQLHKLEGPPLAVADEGSSWNILAVADCTPLLCPYRKGRGSVQNQDGFKSSLENVAALEANGLELDACPWRPVRWVVIYVFRVRKQPPSYV